MSFLEPLPYDDDFHFCESRRASGSLTNVEKYVDPQYTVKAYGTTQLGYMTPGNSPTDTTPRRESFASSCFYGSSAASSFMSHSGNVTPSLATPGSSASNSRRQSVLLPERQQYLSVTSSSPSNHPQGPKNAVATDQFALQDSSIAPYLANANELSLDSEGAAACVAEGELAMMVDNLIGKAPTQWTTYSPQSATSSWYRPLQADQIDESTSWSCDPQAERTNPMGARSAHTFETNQPLFGPAQPTIFKDSPSHPARGAYNTEGSPSPNAPSLDPPFECSVNKSGNDMEIPDNENIATKHFATLEEVFIGPSLSQISSPPSDNDLERSQAPSRMRRHNRRRRQSQGATCELIGYRRESKNKNYQCPEPNCDYACQRHEHLERHIKSKHMKGGPEELPCAFHDCIDRRTGKHRNILARVDNLKAHYNNTHFRYGSSENGGKNARKSMKETYEMGLSLYDYRWSLLLAKKMNVNEEVEKELHVWKMLGYSIRETRDIKVKDVKPDCQEPGDSYLQEYDPRWRALWDGTLTFDKAMSKGKYMKESDAQGLLGVTMLETEAMGIKSLDPRWKVLLGGRMSVEQSEKLGVKERNPKWKDLVAKRRVRCGVEKL